MRYTTHSATTAFGLVALSIVAAAILASPGPLHAEMHHTAVAGDALKWGPAPPSLPPGAQAATLLGSPAKDGPFVFRIKFPAGYIVPPHRHSKDEAVTVISGRFVISAGEKVDKTALKGMPAGSFFHMMAGTAHYAFAEAESVVQGHGMGPFDVIYVDPKDDPRKK